MASKAPRPQVGDLVCEHGHLIGYRCMRCLEQCQRAGHIGVEHGYKTECAWGAHPYEGPVMPNAPDGAQAHGKESK